MTEAERIAHLYAGKDQSYFLLAAAIQRAIDEAVRETQMPARNIAYSYLPGKRKADLDKMLLHDVIFLALGSGEPVTAKPAEERGLQLGRVRCNHCMSIFDEDMIDVDAQGPDTGETCPVCSKGDALMDLGAEVEARVKGPEVAE